MALSGRAMVALLVVLGLHSAAATEYIVGNNTGGWTFDTSNSLYDDQFQNIQLLVGDTLLFPFVTGFHNVFEIPVTDLASCDYSNPIGTYNSTNSTITLATAGRHAYICAIPTHCTSGMHLSVRVTAAAPTPSPTPPPTPPPVSPPTPAPVTPPTPAPVTPTPAPAPVTPTPAPAPVTATPAPAPVTATPAPAPVIATPAPAPTTEAPTPVPTAGVPSSSSPILTAPAPAPETPTSGTTGSVISSGSAVFMAAIVGGLAFLLV